MNEHDATVRDLERTVEELRTTIDDLRDQVTHWRGLSRILGISLAHPIEGRLKLEREEGDRYRLAVWVLASWAYTATADRADPGTTPDDWVRWSLEQMSDPKPPPAPSVVG